MDGDKALQYVRFRHDALGDITRIQRQQKFLRAVARRMTAPENFLKLTDVIDEIMKNVETDMLGKDLVALARISKEVQPEKVEMEMLPAAPQNIGGGSYMRLDTVKTAEAVDRLLKFLPPAAPKPTVEVLNGTGVPGTAARIAELYTKAGYQVVSTGNAASYTYDQSEIDTRTKDTKAALDVGTIISCSKIVEIPKEAGLKPMLPSLLERIQTFRSDDTSNHRGKTNLIVQAAESKKAENVQILDLQQRTLIADYFVVCSGGSNIQIKGIVDGVLTLSPTTG